jgi:hypothetical protein
MFSGRTNPDLQRKGDVEDPLAVEKRLTNTRKFDDCLNTIKSSLSAHAMVNKKQLRFATAFSKGATLGPGRNKAKPGLQWSYYLLLTFLGQSSKKFSFTGFIASTERLFGVKGVPCKLRVSPPALVTKYDAQYLTYVSGGNAVGCNS